MKSVVELITEGHALMTPAEARTRLTLARNSKGEAVSPYDPKATCFCMIGAIHHVVGPHATTPELLDAKHNVLMSLTQALPHVSKQHDNIVHFNDAHNTSHEQVLAVFDKALELAYAPAS